MKMTATDFEVLTPRSDLTPLASAVVKNRIELFNSVHNDKSGLAATVKLDGTENKNSDLWADKFKNVKDSLALSGITGGNTVDPAGGFAGALAARANADKSADTSKSNGWSV